MTKSPKYKMVLALQALTVIILVAADRLSKLWVMRNMYLTESRELLPGLLRLTYVQNDGAAFSILRGKRWFLVAVMSILCVVIIYMLVSRRIPHPMGNWALVVVLGGAIGNLIDRFYMGSVVDMFEFEFVRFAVFNVGDTFIVCGGIVACIYYIFIHDRIAKSVENEKLQD